MSNEVNNLKLLGTSASKPPLGIVPAHGLVGAARVLEDSAIKYAAGNWIAQSADDAASAYDSAQLRHRLARTPLSSVVMAADFAALDADSGLPHIDHEITGLLILRTLMIRDGVLPEDPGQGLRKRASLVVTAPSEIDNDEPADDEPADDDGAMHTTPTDDDLDVLRMAATNAEITRRAEECHLAAERKAAWDRRGRK